MFNDLAKAIAFFEDMINKMQNSSPELAEQANHYAVANTAMQLILSDPIVALRLQQLRMTKD